MAVAGSPDEQKNYVNAALYEAFNIPELCEKSSWLGGITGDSGDEWENMAGRVIQFTRNRVEKELDTCTWDIVGSELCNMTPVCSLQTSIWLLPTEQETKWH